MNAVAQTLVDATTTLDDLFRERIESLTLTSAPPAVTFHPAHGCAQPITTPLVNDGRKVSRNRRLKTEQVRAPSD